MQQQQQQQQHCLITKNSINVNINSNSAAHAVTPAWKSSVAPNSVHFWKQCSASELLLSLSAVKSVDCYVYWLLAVGSRTAVSVANKLLKAAPAVRSLLTAGNRTAVNTHSTLLILARQTAASIVTKQYSVSRVQAGCCSPVMLSAVNRAAASAAHTLLVACCLLIHSQLFKPISVQGGHLLAVAEMHLKIM